MSRLAATLLALIAAMFGQALSASTALAAASDSGTVYVYDGHDHAAATGYTTTERGPPTCGDTTAPTFDSVDLLSRGVSACSDRSTTLPRTTYDDPSGFVRHARATGTANDDAEVLDGDLLSRQRWRVAANSLRGVSAAERSIAGDARAIYQSDALGEIRAAHAAGRSAEVSINGTTVLYEPGMAESGMTLFGEHGLVIGRGAFVSESELAKTIAHESYRLPSSSSEGGVDAGLVKAGTNSAFRFAERVGGYVMGGP